MKKYILIAIIGLVNTMSNINASSVHLENENDIRRVYRNVMEFCSYHQKQLLDLKEKNFDSTKCANTFQEIRKANSELMIEFNDNPMYFISDLLKTISYLKENDVLAKNIIGNKNYDHLCIGLRYLDEVIYGFSEESKRK